jgi:hypothetical protein
VNVETVSFEVPAGVPLFSDVTLRRLAEECNAFISKGQ